MSGLNLHHIVMLQNSTLLSGSCVFRWRLWLKELWRTWNLPSSKNIIVAKSISSNDNWIGYSIVLLFQPIISARQSFERCGLVWKFKMAAAKVASSSCYLSGKSFLWTERSFNLTVKALKNTSLKRVRFPKCQSVEMLQGGFAWSVELERLEHGVRSATIQIHLLIGRFPFAPSIPLLQWMFVLTIVKKQTI